MNEPRIVEVGEFLINLNHVGYIKKFGPTGKIGIAMIQTPSEAPWDIILESPDAQEFCEFIKARYSIKVIGE